MSKSWWKALKNSSTLDCLACLVSDWMQIYSTLFLLSFQSVHIYSCVKSFWQRWVWPFNIASMTLGEQLIVSSLKLLHSSLHEQFWISRKHHLGNNAATYECNPRLLAPLCLPTSMVYVSANFFTISSMILPHQQVALVPQLAHKSTHPWLLVLLLLVKVSKYWKRASQTTLCLEKWKALPIRLTDSFFSLGYPSTQAAGCLCFAQHQILTGADSHYLPPSEACALEFLQLNLT